METMRLELRDLRESQREEERRISDESRLLYAEAFGLGSINLGSAKSDSEVSAGSLTNNVDLTICFDVLGSQDRLSGHKQQSARETVV